MWRALSLLSVKFFDWRLPSPVGGGGALIPKHQRFLLTVHQRTSQPGTVDVDRCVITCRPIAVSPFGPISLVWKHDGYLAASVCYFILRYNIHLHCFSAPGTEYMATKVSAHSDDLEAQIKLGNLALGVGTQ